MDAQQTERSTKNLKYLLCTRHDSKIRLTITMTLQNGYYDYPLFTDEEMETKRK